MSDGSSGRIIGTIIGAAAAYFTGGISLGAGALIGGAIGSLADPKTKTYGPRLDDLTVQYSSYGTGVPRIYGTDRVSGNVIWTTPKIELATTSSGGKGGGTENTSYAYYVYMRMVLCETPKSGAPVSIMQILKDGKLIWDQTMGIPIDQALTSATNLYASFVLYQGGADQLPDPVEEGFTGGPGSCSAYRGVVSIRMNAIECPDGRVPQFSFVLTDSLGDTAKTLYTTSENAAGWAAADSVWSWVTDNAKPNSVVSIFRSAPGAAPLPVGVVDLGQAYVNRGQPFALNGALSPMAIYGFGYQDGTDHWSSVRTLDLQTNQIKELGKVPFDTSGATVADGIGSNPCGAYDPISDQYAVTGGYTGSANPPTLTVYPGIQACDTTLMTAESPIAFYNNQIYFLNFIAGVAQLVLIDATTGALAAQYAGPTIGGATVVGCRISVSANGIFVRLVGSSTAFNYQITLDSGLSSWIPFPGDSAYVDGSTEMTVATSSAWFSTTGAVIGPSSGGGWTFVQYAAFDPNPVTVSSIIAAECEVAGQSFYDVTEIPDSDTVFGYTLTNPAPARSNIDPLMQAFGIYSVDEDGLIKFRKMDELDVVAYVSNAELGQGSAGDTPADPLPLVRAQATDLPKSVTVSYIEPDFDFQTASVQVVRQLTQATEDTAITLAIGMTSDQAMACAQRTMYQAWSGQNARTAIVSRKYAFVSPGDGVEIEDPPGKVGVYRVNTVDDSGLLITWGLLPGDAELFSQTAVGATGFSKQSVTPTPQPLRAQILDMPIVRDQDNNAGPYVALDSFGSVPANGQLLVGDGVASLVPVGTVTASAPIGFVETVLGSHMHEWLDERNLFTINIGDDIFNSVTRDVLLANGGDFWALGAPGRWEIGCSAVGDSLGGGRYILSRHLRGLFGTERNVGNHVAGDVFVLIRPVGMLRPDTGVGGIGQSKTYRPVTRGANPDNAMTQTYANTGEGLMPLSPINPRRTSTNDFTIDRRSRLAMNNTTGTLPLGETTERYSWEFYDSTFTNLRATIVTNVPTVTAAQQTAAGITPSATAYILVGQVSDSVGVGHQLQATIP